MHLFPTWYGLCLLYTSSYNKWLGDQAKPSHRELLRVAIDNALSQSPADFEELLKLLQEYGCEVSKRGKSYRLKLSGWEKDVYKRQALRTVPTMCAELKRNCERHRSIPIQLPMRENMGSWSSTELPTM